MKYFLVVHLLTQATVYICLTSLINSLSLMKKKSVRNQRDSTLAGGGCDCGSRSFPSSSLVFCALVESAEQSAWMYLNFALGIRQWYTHVGSFPPKTAHKVLYPGYQFVSWSKFSEKDTYEKIQQGFFWGSLFNSVKIQYKTHDCMQKAYELFRKLVFSGTNLFDQNILNPMLLEQPFILWRILLFLFFLFYYFSYQFLVFSHYLWLKDEFNYSSVTHCLCK